MAIVKKEFFSCDEQDICKLIQEELGITCYDSIVAYEELGNQVLRVNVSLADKYDLGVFNEMVLNSESPKYKLGSLLSILCTNGHLEAGEYVIDCTW